MKAFERCVVGGLPLRNRIAMAPMTRFFNKEDGIPRQAKVDYYQRRAKGEVGLIISEGTYIDYLHSFQTRDIPRFESEEQLDGWKRISDAIHSEGSAFAPQLWHTGQYAHDPIKPTTMKPENYEQVLNAFVKAARNAKKIGCDALEIHGAHGYLLDSFLSTKHNPDKTLEERMAFPLQVVREMRREVGPDFPIIYRFSQWSLDNYQEIKWKDPKELQTWTEGLRDAGVSILHVSTQSALQAGFPELDGVKTLAEWSKEVSGLPVIAVGTAGLVPETLKQEDGTFDPDDPEPLLKLVEDGKIDILAVGRSLIPNPNWVSLARSGDWKSMKPWNVSLAKELY